MRQLHTLFNSAKTWHENVFWFLCFAPNLTELNLKLFCSDVQNNFRFSAGKFREKHKNQQTITFTCQFLAEMNKIWSCFIFIKSCMRYHLFMHHGILKRLHPTNIYTTVVLTMLIITYLLSYFQPSLAKFTGRRFTQNVYQLLPRFLQNMLLKAQKKRVIYWQCSYVGKDLILFKNSQLRK